MLKVTINGKEIVAGEGTTILEAAKQAAIHIPTLCFLEKLAPTGACRACLVQCPSEAIRAPLKGES